MLAFKVNLAFSWANPTFVTISILNTQVSGTTFQAPTVSTLQVTPASSDYNCFVINNFFVGAPNANYKVFADMQTKESNPASGTPFYALRPDYLYDYTGGPQSSGTFQFRLDQKFQPNSTPTVYEDLGAIELDTTINFLIIA